ncbi:glycosyltransferase [Streptococcus azizii]
MELSIIIPIYNVEAYLSQCLDSVYQLDRQIQYEVILVDDGSTDSSSRILETYSTRYAERTTVIHQQNQGLSAARNSGMRVAKGDYLLFVDSDDVIEADKVELLLRGAQKDGVEIALGEYYYLIEGETSTSKSIQRRLAHPRLQEKMSGLEMADHLLEPITNNVRVEACANLYQHSFLKEHQLYFLDGLLHEDVLFTFTALMKATLVKYYPLIFYLYRSRANSIMATSLDRINGLNKLYIIETLLDYAERHHIQSRSLESCLSTQYFGLVRHYKLSNEKIEQRLANCRKWSLSARLRYCFISYFKRNAIEVVGKVGRR